MKQETERWVDHAKSDLRGAAVVQKEELPGAVLFFCQQAIEKMLKAIWVETQPSVPPRTHNLRQLVSELGLVLSSENDELLQTLTFEYQTARYPDTIGTDSEYSLSDTAGYLQSTEELYTWLLQQLT